jgi:hypothetical protein
VFLIDELRLGEALETKKKGMVSHPRVLTQRTPVLRGGYTTSSWRPS